MKQIKLTQGKYTLVDDEDYEWLNQWKWYVYGLNFNFAARSVRFNHKKKTILMHRLILNFPEKKEIDHINGSQLDNRRSNLRLCIHKENMRNQKVRKDNKAGYRGVSWKTGEQRWYSTINIDGRQKYLGSFKIKEKAAKMYNEAAKKYFGEFARLNNI